MNDPTPTQRIQTYFQGMPQKYIVTADVSALVGMLFFGFATSYIFPAFVSSLVFDKQSNTLMLMKIMGLKMGNYWAANMLAFIVEYFIVNVILMASGIIFGIRLFTQTR